MVGLYELVARNRPELYELIWGLYGVVDDIIYCSLSNCTRTLDTLDGRRSKNAPHTH